MGFSTTGETCHGCRSLSARPAAQHPRPALLRKHIQHSDCPWRTGLRRAAKHGAELGGLEDTVVVVGAGVAGLAAAAALHKLGIPVAVVEREGGLRQEGSALNLWTNAFRALDALGVAGPLRDTYLNLDRVELCTAEGRTLNAFSFDDCDSGPHESRGVQRPALLAGLASLLPESALHFGVPVTGASPTQTGAQVELGGGRQLRCRAVVGADGVRSAVAGSLGLSPPAYAGYTSFRGVAKFPKGALPLPRSTIRQVWGAGVRAGMYPMTETNVYWFTCFNAPAGVPQQSPEQRKAEAVAHVQGWAFGVEEAIQNTPAEDVSRARLGDRWMAPGRPYGRGCVTLVGDAAHPMTPNLGQGGCTALEDAIVLARHLSQAAQPGTSASSSSADGTASALREFEKERTRRVLPLTLRSNAFGRLLQLPYAPVVAVRNAVVPRMSFSHFLDHTAYDCGRLDTAASEH